MAAEFYTFNPKQDELLRARRAEVCQDIREAHRDGFTVWVFCVWCGHATITEPSFLMAQVKNAPDLIDALEKRLTCSSCHRAGVRIIPTDRQIVSFDRMGSNRR
jgi:hypothetical protein